MNEVVWRESGRGRERERCCRWDLSGKCAIVFGLGLLVCFLFYRLLCRCCFKMVLQFSWCRNCAPIDSSDIASASDWSADPKLSSFKQCLKAVHCPLYQQQQHLFPLSLLIQLAIKWCTELPFVSATAIVLCLSHLGAATVLHSVLHRQERSRKSSVQSSLVCSSFSHLSTA